jgi:hypothetical protein
MDLSKLPRMSKTDRPPNDPEDAPLVAETAEVPPAAPPAAPVRPVEEVYEPGTAGIGAEVWLSAVIGLICLLMGRNFAGWLLARLTGRTYHTGVNWVEGPRAGTEVAYTELLGAPIWTDSAMFLFGLALMFEAVVLATVHSRFRAKRPLLVVALAVAVVATAYNVFVALRLLMDGALPLMSLLAAAFGGYIAAHEWALLKRLPRSRPVAA